MAAEGQSTKRRKVGAAGVTVGRREVPAPAPGHLCMTADRAAPTAHWLPRGAPPTPLEAAERRLAFGAARHRRLGESAGCSLARLADDIGDIVGVRTTGCEDSPLHVLPVSPCSPFPPCSPCVEETEAERQPRRAQVRPRS